jgi:hypothetical protein
MSKGSKRPSWKVIRNRYNRIGRELAQLAAAHAPPAATQAAPELPPRRLRAPAKPKIARPRRERTAREQAIYDWYFYGEADDPPPEGVTEAELMQVRRSARRSSQ